VVRVVRVVIVYVPRSNKGHLPLTKTCLLALLSLSSTLTLNAHKLTSKWYPLYSPPALYFKSLPFSIILNHCIIRLAVIIKRCTWAKKDKINKMNLGDKWEINNILGERITKLGRKYKVAWKLTWVYKSGFLNSKNALKSYQRRVWYAKVRSL